MSDGERTGDAGQPAGETPPIDETIRRVGTAGREAMGATGDSLRALRSLLSADIAMARSAMGRALAWTGVAVVFGASAWLLATAAAVALMQSFGLSWLSSLSIAALFNVAVTALAAWRTARFFDYMGLHATRRQLSRMGLFQEDDEDGDPADTAPPTPPSPTMPVPPVAPAPATPATGEPPR